MRYLIAHSFDPAAMRPGLIDSYPWGGVYRPETSFRLGWSEEGIRLLLRCAEENPRATRKGVDAAGVCKDSCMEFFLAPGKTAYDGYLNFEMNADAALLLCFGKGRHGREKIRWPVEGLRLDADRREPGTWKLDLTIPFSLIARYFPDFRAEKGLLMHGNLYKCGDDTACPHYGCFFPIDTKLVPSPDFHQPASFGEFVLG